MNYTAGFKFKDQDHLSFNALVFETKEECEQYAEDLLMRWYVPTGYEIVETDEKANYKITENKIVRMEG